MYAARVFSLLMILLTPVGGSIFAAQECKPLLDKSLSQWRIDGTGFNLY
jgi:hypothetical protein